VRSAVNWVFQYNFGNLTLAKHKHIDIRLYNRAAWDKNVDEGNEFTIPASHETIEAARRGDIELYLTGSRPAPRDWLPDLRGLKVLCLASGGGQQSPLLAAAGADVTVLDNSSRQLDQDRLVAKRENLAIRTLQGDMANLSVFANESFSLIIHPVSNVFVPEIRPVWEECYRVLKPGGRLLSGFMNPVFYIFDRDLMDADGILQVKYPLPYSDLTSISPDKLQKYMDSGWPLEFGHTLEAQIGGQIKVGFIIDGFYEDRDPRSKLDRYMPIYIATRAFKR
jgi:SAM-dependent methyltransferase